MRAKRGVRVFLATLVFCLASGFAYAQSTTTSSLSGVVVDHNGGVIPGASVLIKNNATGVETDLVTNRDGEFAAPSLAAGVYTVTVKLSSFKTTLVKDVRVEAATPANLPKITLEVGDVEEQVSVVAQTELVQTSGTSVTSTIGITQIMNLPIVEENGSAFIANFPGVDTSSGGHSVRSSSINGLPQTAINITLDGINDVDNSVKDTDGFWAMVHPKLDQVEEVTLTGAVPGVDSSGQGAVTVKWVTRSGSNSFEGSAFEYFRHWDLNTNYFFNAFNGLGKNQIELNQFGAREGGPIVKNKLFFFVEEEEFRRPGSTTYTRNVLTSPAQSGVFQYSTPSGVKSVNLLSLAGANGFTSTQDPTVNSLLNLIDGATLTQGTIKASADPNVANYNYQGVAGRIEHNPTIRMDYNISPTERLSGTYNWQEAYQHPDGLNNNGPTFPGLPNYLDQTSFRNLGSYTLRSILAPTMVNELVGGFLWSPINFSGPLGPAQFVNQGGNALGFGSMSGVNLTSATVSTSISSRNASHWDLNDTLSYLRGKHSLSFGGTFTQVNYWADAQTAAPSVTFGVNSTSDPAIAMFTTANFPGASAQNLADAENLYGLLTGRVTAINGNIRLDPTTNQYVYLGNSQQAGGQKEFGLFAEDSWHATQGLTFNLGVRWEVQLPFTPNNSAMSTASYASFCGVSGVGSNGTCNLFQPGVEPGQVTTYTQYQAGSPGYHTEWGNVGPSLGVAWRPRVQTGLLRPILGDPEEATLSAGWALAYDRDAIADYSNVFAANPGLTVTENRNATTGLLVPPGQTWPVLYRNTPLLGPPPFCSSTVTTLCMPTTPVYPIAASLSNSVNIFDPNFQMPRTESATIGFERTVSKDMAIAIRYVGTRNHDGTLMVNYNELDILQNGFANEFLLAQKNLAANIASGRGATFKYEGPGTGTSPLPIYLANINGVNASLANNPAAYTGSNWTNSTMINQLGPILPGTPILTAASTLQSNATFNANMLAAGLPANFWVMNPNVCASGPGCGANLDTNLGFSKYDSLQLELRRRLANGFTLTANYTFGSRYTSVLDTLNRPEYLVLDNANAVRQALKINWTWDIPVGRGRHFGSSLSGWANGLIGNWTFSGVGRVQSGEIVDFGNVKLVGMTLQQLQSMFRIAIHNNPNTGLPTVYDLPQTVVDNTILAFSTSGTTASGYSGAAPTGQYLAPPNSSACVQAYRGDCAPHDVFVTGPVYSRFDMTLRKSFPLGGHTNFQVEIDELNVFNAIGFNVVGAVSGSMPFGPTFGQVTSAYQDVSNTFDPGGRIGQLMFRINW